MKKRASLPPAPSPAVSPRDLVPALVAALVSLGLFTASALGAVGWHLAAIASALVWAGAAGLLAWMLQHRARGLHQQADALQSLEELQAHYGLAEHLGAFGTWVIDRSDRRQAWSEGAFRLFGYDPKAGEPRLRSFTERIHPEDRDRWMEAHRRALRHGGEVRLEYRFERPDGDLIWVRSVGRAQDERNGRHDRIGGVAHDITGMRAMQKQLATSEAKFRNLTRMSSDWIWETDAFHRWSQISESADMVLGRWVRQLIGRPIWDLPSGKFAFEQVDWEAQRSQMDSQAPFEDFEYALIDQEGAMRFLSISGHPVFENDGRFSGYRGIGKDITREKQQRLLLRMESDLAAIMREQTEPDRVITACIITLCGTLGWVGGANLTRHNAQTYVVRERWGYPAFIQALSELPTEIPMAEDGTEARTWNQARPAWLPDLARQGPALAERFQAERCGAQAAFFAPILSESGSPMSVLVFLAPTGFRDDGFLEQIGEILSRNLSLFLQRKSAEKRLTHQSLHDALTSLPNRVYLTHQLERHLEQGESAAVLYIDLDRYKLINDTLGHSAGDQVLIEVAVRLRGAIRPDDVAGRMGGDEFVLLLPGLEDHDEILRIARGVLEALERPFILQNRAFFLSASIGVSVAPHDGRDARLLIRCADTAMYRVKSEGRNDVRFFTGELTDERTQQLQTAAELPLALQRGELDLHYQPILDVATRGVVGFEALMRWNHPVRGLLSADAFLPAAEQGSLARELELWAIRRALADRAALGVDDYDGASVSVNLSPRQLAEDGFLALLNQQLQEHGLPGDRLRIELTESAFIENPEATARLIAEVRRLGVQVIIDNFGTGYASLSYLKNLPADGIKIDQTFVRALHQDRGNAAIVQAVITLAAQLDVAVMAEGVESPAELAALRHYGCHQMQGTLIAEPMPLAQLRDFLDALPEVRRMHVIQLQSRTLAQARA